MSYEIFFLILLLFTFNVYSQDILKISGPGKLIADFHSTGSAANVSGKYLEKYQTLVSTIEGTNTVKCMVRIGGTVNVIGVWEMNDLNDIELKVYEVEMVQGRKDILLVGLLDGKGLDLNLFRLNGEDLDELGYNYLEQKVPNQPIEILISSDKLKIIYDKGAEQPSYGIENGKFTELSEN